MSEECTHSYGEPKSGWATCLLCGNKNRVKFIKDEQYASNQVVAPTPPQNEIEKIEGGVTMAETFETKAGETVTIHNDTVTGETPELKMPKAKEPKEVITTVLSSGAIATGPVVTIQCEHINEDGTVCGKDRVIKVQDKFQVHFCMEHQKQALNKKRYENRKKNKAIKKAEAAANAPAVEVTPEVAQG